MEKEMNFGVYNKNAIIDSAGPNGPFIVLGATVGKRFQRVFK